MDSMENPIFGLTIIGVAATCIILIDAKTVVIRIKYASDRFIRTVRRICVLNTKLSFKQKNRKTRKLRRRDHARANDVPKTAAVVRCIRAGRFVFTRTALRTRSHAHSCSTKRKIKNYNSTDGVLKKKKTAIRNDDYNIVIYDGARVR